MLFNYSDPYCMKSLLIIGSKSAKLTSKQFPGVMLLSKWFYNVSLRVTSLWNPSRTICDLPAASLVICDLGAAILLVCVLRALSHLSVCKLWVISEAATRGVL